jgi:glycerol-3-phosphate dehydrogenase
MMKLGKLMGSDPQTLSGLAGYGDLMLTCFGSLSRNLSVGRKLGEGQSLDEILKGMTEVAEGVWTARAVRTLASRYGDVQLPIMFAVAAVIDGKMSPKEAVAGLMALPAHKEYD